MAAEIEVVGVEIGNCQAVESWVVPEEARLSPNEEIVLDDLSDWVKQKHGEVNSVCFPKEGVEHDERDHHEIHQKCCIYHVDVFQVDVFA